MVETVLSELELCGIELGGIELRAIDFRDAAPPRAGWRAENLPPSMRPDPDAWDGKCSVVLF